MRSYHFSSYEFVLRGPQFFFLFTFVVPIVKFFQRTQNLRACRAWRSELKKLSKYKNFCFSERIKTLQFRENLDERKRIKFNVKKEEAVDLSLSVIQKKIHCRSTEASLIGRNLIHWAENIKFYYYGANVPEMF